MEPKKNNFLIKRFKFISERKQIERAEYELFHWETVDIFCFFKIYFARRNLRRIDEEYLLG